jgi:hypothetical protein
MKTYSCLIEISTTDDVAREEIIFTLQALPRAVPNIKELYVKKLNRIIEETDNANDG